MLNVFLIKERSLLIFLKIFFFFCLLPEAKYKAKYGKTLKIFTPKQTENLSIRILVNKRENRIYL